MSATAFYSRKMIHFLSKMTAASQGKVLLCLQGQCHGDLGHERCFQMPFYFRRTTGNAKIYVYTV